MTDVGHQRGGPAPDTGAVVSATLWRNGDFLKFWSGETLSLFGSQVTTLALPLTAVVYLNATAQQVGMLQFLQLIPFLFLALIFGVWVDRCRRKRIMLLANVARMILIALVPLLAGLHWLSIGVLLVIACVMGVFTVLFDVSWMSYVPTLVKDAKLYGEANQKLGVTQSTTNVAGPGAAGVLVGWLGAPIALVVDALSYVASLVTLLWIRTPEPPVPAPTTRRRIGRELVDGIRWVFQHTSLRTLAMLAPFTNFSLTCVQTLFLLYAIRYKGLSSAEVGLVLSVSAAGGLVGALLSKAVMRRFRFGPAYGVALAGVYASPLLLLLAAGPHPVVIGVFILSFVISDVGGGLSNVMQLTLRQTCTPASLMGRMSAAFRTLLFGGAAVGGLCAGLIGGGLGLRTGLTVVAIGSAAMLVPLALSSVVRLRRIPDPVATS